MKAIIKFEGQIEVEVDELPNPEDDATSRHVWRVLEAASFEFFQDIGLEATDVSAVCRECGCTNDNRCAGGCDWYEIDLCSTHQTA